MKTFSTTAIAVVIIAVFIGCSNDSTNTTPTVIQITQAQLDAATIVYSPKDTGVVNDPYAAFVNPPLFNDTVTRDKKIRYMTANIKAGDAIVPGTIFIRKKFDNLGGNAHSATPNDIVVFVKREAGYNTDSKDFEMMKFTPTTYAMKGVDLTKYPNGLLPPTTDSTRGKDPVFFAKCLSCHNNTSSTGGDFLFSK
jgi:hypothetical protein